MTTPMKDWRPFEHIDEACRLLEVQQARKGGAYVITPIPLTQAMVHLAIAEAKMKGRQRA